MNDHIPEQLKSLAVQMDLLNPDEHNARAHDDVGISAIMESFKQFGQDQLLVVQKDGMIVRKGNGRLEAAKRLGWKYIAAIIIDEDDTSAMARAIADNRTGDLSDWDFSNLTDVLDELAGTEWEQSLGFEKAELDNLLSQAAVSEDDLVVADPVETTRAETLTAKAKKAAKIHTCPSCAHKFEE